MTVPPITVFAPITFPTHPMSNITPFTYRDGWTFLELVEGLREYVTQVLVPAVDENFADLVQSWADALEQVQEENAATIAAIQAIVDDINNRMGSEPIQYVTLGNVDYTVTIQPTWPTNQPVVYRITSVAGHTGELLFAGNVDGSTIVIPDEGLTWVEVVPDGDGTWTARNIYPNSATFNVRDYGASGNGTTDDSVAIRRAVTLADALSGTVIMPAGTYLVSADPSTEIYGNDGAPWAANGSAINLPGHVSLIGDGASIHCADPAINIISVVTVDGCTISGLNLSNEWEIGNTGAGHGIFTVSSAPEAIDDTLNFTVRNVTIRNVGSYGIGIQAGNPQNVTIDNIIIDSIGADGLDLKSRSSNTIPRGNTVNNVTIRNHGNRITGSAGIDIRGVWNLSNISVREYGAAGGNPDFLFAGIRFRTHQPVTVPPTVDGSHSTLTNFNIQAATPSVLDTHGLFMGSDEVTVNNGVIQDCFVGLVYSGNADGVPNGNIVSNVIVRGCQTGIEITSSCTNNMFIGCKTFNSPVRGFRNAGINTTFIGCESSGDTLAFDTSSAALPTESILNSRVPGMPFLTSRPAAANRFDIGVNGDSADIDLRLDAKGAGVLRFGDYVTAGGLSIVGYITVKDDGGGFRRLAVV